jgi:hypothetical protein
VILHVGHGMNQYIYPGARYYLERGLLLSAGSGHVHCMHDRPAPGYAVSHLSVVAFQGIEVAFQGIEVAFQGIEVAINVASAR